MMITNDFQNLFSAFSETEYGSQKKLVLNAPVKVFYGCNQDGHYRLSFLATVQVPKLESTQMIKVIRGEEHNMYWLCFELLGPEARSAFFAFSASLVQAIEGTLNEVSALNAIKKRYISWKALFKNEKKSKISVELIQGLFGELYCLLYCITPKYGVERAIKGWSGPDKTSKDYSIGTDWYEVKTVGANSNNVRISSLAQLNSDYPGHLAVLKVERMSQEFSGENSCILELINKLLGIIHNEEIEDVLMSKIGAYGISVDSEEINTKFSTVSFKVYSIINGFPRITEKEVPYCEITEVEYSIAIPGIERYLEVEL